MVTISLREQVAAVSGGSRGIGAATVRLLAEAGASVAFSYLHNRAAADAVVAACPPGRAFAVAGDAGDPQHGADLVRAAAERFGRLDIAVANAGIWNIDDLPIEAMDPAAWNETLDCNLGGVYSLARAAVIQMKAQSVGVPPGGGNPVRGRIVAIASTAGQRGEAWHTHYGAAKAGVIGFVRGLAPELAPAGILVNCVAPGWVETDMIRPVMAARPERVVGAIPLGRLGKPEEIAGCVLFLCTPWAEFMTGSVLSANGGAVLA